MSDKQFSVGDVLRYVPGRDWDELPWNGDEYTVLETRGSDGKQMLTLDVPFSQKHFYADRFTLIRPASPAEPAKGGWVPKVGERVRLTGYAALLNGQITTILECSCPGIYKLAPLQNAPSQTNWQVRVQNLEPAPVAADAKEVDALIDQIDRETREVIKGQNVTTIGIDPATDAPQEFKDKCAAFNATQARSAFDGHTKDGYGPARGIPCCTTNMLGYRCGCSSPAYLVSPKRDPYKKTCGTEESDTHNTLVWAKLKGPRFIADVAESPSPRRPNRKYDPRPGIDTDWPAGDERSEP